MERGSRSDSESGRLSRLEFRPAAAGDVEDAYRWYERQRPGLGEAFLLDVERATESVRESPSRFRVIHRETRRVLLRGFPYGLFFRAFDDRIVVVACMHASRDPLRWSSRK